MPTLLDEPARDGDERTQAGACTPYRAPGRGHIGPEQGVIEEARRRRRARRARLSAAALLTLVGIGAVVWAVSGQGAAAERGAIAHAAARAGASRQTAAAGFGIRLSPALDGGQYGWCVGLEEPGFGGIAGGGCSATPTESLPLSMVLTSADARTRRESIVVLTTPQVAAVRVGARRVVATTGLPGLPYGLRAARIVVPFMGRHTAAGRVVFPAPAEPSLTPLNSVGRPIASALVRPSAQTPALAARGPCALKAGGVPGLAPKWSHVASELAPYRGALVGRAFFSCIDTEYFLHNWPLDAAILLDAAHPGSAPAAIPGLSPVPGRAGYLNGPGDFKGELTATRRGNAWLVVAGGSGLAQRIDVLSHLTATVKP
jgi:hypothetical protein